MTIAKIEFSGNINSRSTKQTLELFNIAEKSNRIRGVILVIDSGGGDAASSEKLAVGIKKLNKRKPVFALLEGLGASGAYWMASAATKVYSMSTTIVGSIGIIGINPDVTNLMEKLGVKIDIVKVGEYKDMLMPFSPISDTAREKYRDILKNSYSIFKNAVSENRKITGENLERVTNGEIFSAKKALELGLVDKIGTFDEVLEDMTKTYGFVPKLKNLEPHRSFFERVFTSNFVQTLILKFIGV